MYQEDKNEYGCPLYNQTGADAIRNWDMIVARLTPALRAAFEAERAARRDDQERFAAERYKA
jgi:hypothetical protein